MALCLAESLVEYQGFDPTDQMERYVRWYRQGHLSSTGRCFDIGNTIRAALHRFEETGNPYSGSPDPRTAGNGSIIAKIDWGESRATFGYERKWSIMNPMTNIPVGAIGTVSVEVTRELTVAHFHPDMPEVYGTPMMIYLMEAASAKAVAKYLPEGWVSVGVAVNIKHLAATPIGFTVTAKAEVVSVSDNTIVFNVEAHDGIDKIGEGTHVRAPVELKRFEQGTASKAAKRDNK